MGPLGRVAIDVADELMGMRDFKTGRLDPALVEIAKRLRVAKQTVVSALRRLKLHGFIDWFRRTRPVEHPEPGGPVVEQDTNAYWFKLPKWALDRVRASLKRGPVPADVQTHAADQAAQLASMLAQASPEERIAFWHGDGPLSGPLKALQASLAQGGAVSPATGLNPRREVK